MSASARDQAITGIGWSRSALTASSSGVRLLSEAHGVQSTAYCIHTRSSDRPQCIRKGKAPAPTARMQNSPGSSQFVGIAAIKASQIRLESQKSTAWWKLGLRGWLEKSSYQLFPCLCIPSINSSSVLRASLLVSLFSSRYSYLASGGSEFWQPQR